MVNPVTEFLDITFEPRSQLSRFDVFTFAMCRMLRSIMIPASVEIISKNCFMKCHFLSSVSFEADSRLNRIEERAFASCESLKSICIPRSVEQIDRECFSRCVSLEILTVECGSKLARVGNPIFPECWRFKWIELQSSGSARSTIVSAVQFPLIHIVSMMNGSRICTSAHFPALIREEFRGGPSPQIPSPLARNRPSAIFSHSTDNATHDDFAIGYDQYLDMT
jgi:hypothetical protein